MSVTELTGGGRQLSSGYPASLQAGSITLGDEAARPSLLGVAAGFYLMSVPLCSATEGLSVIPQIIGAAVGLLWLGYSLARGRSLAWPGTVVLYCAWFAWASLSTLLVEWGSYALPTWMGIGKVVVMTWLVSQCIRTRGDLLFSFLAVAVAAPIVLVTGRQDIQHALAHQAGYSAVGSRAAETLLGNPNILALFGLMALIGAVLLLLAYRNLLLRILAGACIPAALYLIAAAGSRKGMGGLMLAGAGFYWFHLRRTSQGRYARHAIMLLIGALLVATAFLFVSNLPTFSRLTDVLSGSGGFEQESRYQYFSIALPEVFRHPLLGLGIEGFALSGLSGGAGHYSHSTITETLVNSGFPGFMMYAAGQVVLYLNLRKLRKQSLPYRDLAVVNFIMIIFTLLLLFQVFSVMFENRMIWPLFGGMCGYLWQLKKTHCVADPGSLYAYGGTGKMSSSR